MASNVKKEKKAKLNTFQNDGSFMEMFKKSQESSQPVPPTSSEEKEKSKPNTEADIPCYSTQTMCYRDEKGGESSSIKSRYQGIIGKRKTLMKTVELREKRKKRREELEEQQNAEQTEEKSSAWKAYMAEVKEYEAKRCGDTDDHKRPLVK